MRVLIVTGGYIDIDYAREFLKINSFDFYIAVDGGLEILDKLCLKPDMILGDFDTVTGECLDKYKKISANGENKKIDIVKLNPIKDSTDTEEAVKYAVSFIIGDKNVRKTCHENDEIIMLGGTGSRLDHSIANIFLLKKTLIDGIKMVMQNHNSKIFMISGYNEIKKDNNYKYISFIQFDGAANGVTLRGFKYDIENFDFDTAKTYRLGVSNEFADNVGIVNIKEGMMLVVMTND